MKHRLLLCALILSLLLGLAACGDKTDTPATKTPETQAPATEAPAKTELKRGKVENGVYTNESIKLRFAAPTGWSFYSDEEIAQANNMSQDLFESQDIKDAVSLAGQYMDMMAVSANSIENVNLIIQPANPFLSAMTDQQIFESLESTYRTQFGSAGMSVEGFELLTAKFCGEDKTVLKLSMTMNGVPLTEYQLWVRYNQDYFSVLTLSSTDLEDPQSILDCFSLLD